MSEELNKEDLEKLTVDELKALMGENELEVKSSYKKADLITVLMGGEIEEVKELNKDGFIPGQPVTREQVREAEAKRK